MAKSLVFCPVCGFGVFMENGAINRARGRGAALYCGRDCAGETRRVARSTQERKAAKAAYDAEYRKRNLAWITARKAEYFQDTYDPEAARIERAARMPAHVEYCRRPAYRVKKRSYDRQYRAKKDYGPFWEAAVTLHTLQEEIDVRATRQEIYEQNGTVNKSIRRKREYEQAVGR